MNSASRTSLSLARLLLAREGARGKNLGGKASAGPAASGADHVVLVCEKLRDVLTVFAGSSGFRSLLSRAVTLAKAQERSLAAVQVLEDGSLAGLEDISVESSTRARESPGGRILVAQLLDLLILFIGEPLTHQLVRSAWPDLPTGALRSRTQDTP